MFHERAAPLARVRIGAAPLGNLYTAVSEADAMATLVEAAALGARALDTAPLYGHGLSEARVGAFHRHHPPLAVSTKVGRRLVPCPPDAIPDHGFAATPPFAPVFDYSRDGVLRAFDDSLARLNTDCVETLLLHDVGAETHGADHPAVLAQALREALPVMAELRATGRAARIGIGVNEIAAVEAVLPTGLIDVVLLAGRYTLLDRSAAALLDRCAAYGVPVLAAGVFNSGLLAGGGTYNYRPASPALLARRDALAAACAAHGVPLAAAALAFPLRHPAVHEIVVGLRSPTEARAAAELLATPIPEALWDALG